MLRFSLSMSARARPFSPCPLSRLTAAEWSHIVSFLPFPDDNILRAATIAGSVLDALLHVWVDFIDTSYLASQFYWDELLASVEWDSIIEAEMQLGPEYDNPDADDGLLDTNGFWIDEDGHWAYDSDDSDRIGM